MGTLVESPDQGLRFDQAGFFGARIADGRIFGEFTVCTPAVPHRVSAWMVWLGLAGLSGLRGRR